MSRCCSNCFGDKHLANEIIPAFAQDMGPCDYCRSKGGHLVEPTQLQDYFELLLGAYEVEPTGSSLVDQLSLDWGLMPAGRLARTQAIQLLIDILGDESSATLRYVPTQPVGELPLHRWQEFRIELMSRNRYFPRSLPDLGRLRELLAYLLAIPSDAQKKMFRARILDSDVIYLAEEMGPPPCALATHGRANPTGIPYLYLASDPTTAISELRPHTGDRACVAEFELSLGLNLVDLRDPKSTVSPFAMSDESKIILLRRDLAFLDELGKELTRPVVPRSAAIEYLPSQFLCEFIKHCGFDGLLYRSSVGHGVNVALFTAEKAHAGRVTAYQVERVTVEIKAGASP